MNLIVLEGPGGSGKTALAKLLGDAFGMPTIARSISSRDPAPENAALDSWSNDLAKYMMAIRSPSPSVIVDRLWVSQWVYGGLRRPSIDKSDVNPIRYWTSVETTIGALTAELSDRHAVSGIVPRNTVPRILIIVLNPPTDQLVAQRQQAGRLFPWYPEQELRRYEDFGLICIKSRWWRYLDSLVYWEKRESAQLVSLVDQFLQGHSLVNMLPRRLTARGVRTPVKQGV